MVHALPLLLRTKAARRPLTPRVHARMAVLRCAQVPAVAGSAQAQQVPSSSAASEEEEDYDIVPESHRAVVGYGCVPVSLTSPRAFSALCARRQSMRSPAVHALCRQSMRCAPQSMRPSYARPHPGSSSCFWKATRTRYLLTILQRRC